MSELRFARLRGRVLATAFAVALLSGVTTLMPRVGYAQETPPPPPPPPEEAAPTTPTTTPQTPNPTSSGTGSGGGGRFLLLPDISLNGILTGHSGTDKRDKERDRFRLSEAEIGIQSYVYPGIKLDSFIVFDGGGEVGVEELFLTYQNVSIAHLPLSAVVGRRKAPFGRVNQLHPHSWLYIVQPYVLSNLVSEESLTGDGGYLSYLLPTGKKLFTQLDLGVWSQSEEAEEIPTPPNPASEIVTSPGAGFKDKFGTARLHLAADMWGGSLELGGSVAGGHGVTYTLNDDGPSVSPRILLSGADVTYRRSGNGTKRLLLRGEYLQHHQEDHSFRRTTDGYYLFADERLDPYNSIGLRYDSTGFSYAPGRMRGISLVATHQLTEATLYRLQLIHSDRPGKRNDDEIYLQIIFGAGPHTHNLE